MFQTTRARLALWYTTVTTILLLLFATGVYLYVRSTLVERIDDTLEHVVEVVKRSLVIETVGNPKTLYRVNVEASFRNNDQRLEDDRIDIEWFNREGELLWSTFTEDLDLPLIVNPYGKTVEVFPNRELRQITNKIELDHYLLGYIRVSHPWFEVTKPSRQLMIDLTIGTAVMSFCAASIGWFLSGLAIQPVIESYQSLKQFTADASHELRNPIAMILTTVQMALAESESGEKILLEKNQLKVIERLTQRLGSLVNDLLFLARSDSGLDTLNWQPVPLDALLIEVLEEQRLAAQKQGLEISLDIADETTLEAEPFSIPGDWDQLARLFTNLISNAIAYSSSPTPIQVNLQKLKKGNRFYLQVQIIDQGLGISEEDLPHIFERFYRVDRARTSQGPVTGSGLGLAIALAIVENHQGQIKVESKLGQGTIFTVILPQSVPKN